MNNKLSLMIIVAGIMFSSCNSQTEKNEQQNSEPTIKSTEITQKKPFTSTHTFIAVYEGTGYTICKGKTANCPDKCGNSGNLANFKVKEYKDLVINGQAGTEKLENYAILTSDYNKKDIDKSYVDVIRNLKKGDEVTIQVEYIYDTTKSTVYTEEKLIQISMNPKNENEKSMTTNNWWEGKRFVNEKSVSKNPIEGGADFLDIKQNNIADYKVGDIVERMTWGNENGKLVLSNNQTKRKVSFKIGKDILEDEFGTIWKIKK